MSSYELCIDVGSNYTTIYKKNSGIVLREPSVLLMSNTGKNLKLINVGLQAQKYCGKLSSDQVLVKPIIEGVIKNVDLAKKMINYFLGKIIQFKMVKPIIKIIVCLPTSLTQKQYEDYKDVFYSIGFAKIDFVYNVVCASLNDSQYFSLGKANMIVNIGAGKTEICSIVNNKIISACSVNVGGNFLDNKIVEHLAKTKNYMVSANIASKIKHEIGSLYETDKSSMEVTVQDLTTQSPINTIITAQELLTPIYEVYFKIMQTIQVFLNNCSPEVVQDIKQEGIIFCGGGAQITGLEKFFKKVLGVSGFVVDNPEVFGVLGSESLFANPAMLQTIVEEN
ncbi:MAG: rod shape-determining protein [Clostridia bacterium]|nr:rod shape-determining protein [Clostridia bacterium]